MSCLPFPLVAFILPSRLPSLWFIIMHTLLLTVSSFICVLASLPASVNAHGFMASPRPRGYNEISYAIDNLRNPTSTGNFCRGKSPDGAVTTINLSDNGNLAIKLALSIGAEHVGPCSLELWNSAGTKKVTLAENVPNCASDQGFKQKSPGASQQCPGLLPSGLVTDDMCLKDWNVNLPDLSGLDFDTGFLRWIWFGQHVSPAEYYENCADVNINYNGAGGSGEASQYEPTPTTTTAATSTTTTTTAAAVTTTTTKTTTKTTKTTSKKPTPTNNSRKHKRQRRKNRRHYCKRDYDESEIELLL